MAMGSLLDMGHGILNIDQKNRSSLWVRGCVYEWLLVVAWVLVQRLLVWWFGVAQILPTIDQT